MCEAPRAFAAKGANISNAPSVLERATTAQALLIIREKAMHGPCIDFVCGGGDSNDE